jgi:hypothetical protein
LHLDKWSLVRQKIMDISTSFILMVIMFQKHSHMVMARKFDVVLGQMLKHSVQFCNFIM